MTTFCCICNKSSSQSGRRHVEASSRELLQVEDFRHACLHRRIHLDEWRPGALEAFAILRRAAGPFRVKRKPKSAWAGLRRIGLRIQVRSSAPPSKHAMAFRLVLLHRESMQKLNRFLWVGIFLMGATTSSTAALLPRPNMVYILCDDLGYGDVQCLNPQGKIPTPHMDRLAAAGMIFTDALPVRRSAPPRVTACSPAAITGAPP